MIHSEILLLGGNGFLGQGLLKELLSRNMNFKSLDKDDIDLFDVASISSLVLVLKDFDNIVLLSSKIGIDIFETNARNAANYNKTIHENVLEALKLASAKYKKSFSVTYYSTSEVFGSLKSKDFFITEDTDYSFDFDNPRHLYSYVKWQAERDYYLLNALHPDIISSIKIVRPFNVYGRNLKRGVVYKMAKTAIEMNLISYRVDTTRTFTDIDIASKMAVDTIVCEHNMKINLVDSRNSLTLESLAKIISKSLNKGVALELLPADKSILYRNVSKVDENADLSFEVMKPHILELALQIINEKAI